MKIEYVFPDGMYGRIPHFAHSAINEYLSAEESKVFIYCVCQKNGYELSTNAIATNTYLPAGMIESCLHSIEKKGFITMNDNELYVNWDYIKEVSNGKKAPARQSTKLIRELDEHGIESEYYDSEPDFMEGLY